MSAATTRAKKYRAHAEQCRAWSDLSQSKVIKQQFLKTALQWENLAREIEDIERMRIFTMTGGGPVVRPFKGSPS